jgi:hypothetical protein
MKTASTIPPGLGLDAGEDGATLPTPEAGIYQACPHQAQGAARPARFTSRVLG